MPRTIEGIGTILYGARDFSADGSYVTTKWFTILYLPILPLKTMRIVGTGKKGLAVYISRTYNILEVTRLNVRQVLSVYLWFAAAAFLMWAWIVQIVQNKWWLIAPSLLMLAIPWFLRRQAWNRMAEKAQRKEMGLTATTID